MTAVISKELILENPGGLHARPAAFLVQLAAKFQSKVKVIFNGKEADGKSVIALMTLGAAQGHQITLVTDGTDEEVAMAEISAYLQQVGK